MWVYLEEFIIGGRVKFKPEALINTKCDKILLLFFQQHLNKNYSDIIVSRGFRIISFVRLFCNLGSYGRFGFLSDWSHLLVDFTYLFRNILNFVKCSPVRFQRTRSNCITTQKKLKNYWFEIANLFLFSRRSLSTRKALAKKKLKVIVKKSVKKSLPSAQKKRSRDTKKSVWS